MNHNDNISILAAKTLKILQGLEQPITAAALAARLDLAGNRESRRRKVRAIVDLLRKDGVWVVAANQAGYWLTEELQTWKDYQEGRTIDAKKILAESHRRKRNAIDANGQGLLFVR